MSKTKNKRATPNFPATVLLRPRLDALWHNPALPKQTDVEIQTALDQLTQGVKPDFLLMTFIRAHQNAPASTQARLGAFLPQWLRSHNHIDTLQELVTHNRLDAELTAIAREWLIASGVSLQAVIDTPIDLFYKAYDLDDKSQALVSIFWYDSPKKNRLVGMNFLIDYNPPWDGAIKDVTVFPKREPREILRRYVDTWAEHGQALKPISGAQAKTKILKALVRNRASRIRLSNDFITNRAAFTRFVLALPNAPETPNFTDENWKALVAPGQSADDIMRYEQTVGRRVRMENGKELLVMGDLDDWNEES